MSMYGQPHPHDVDGAAESPLESCLLDRRLFVGSAINGTTARYERIKDPDGHWKDIVFQVTLVVAPPPRVSYVLAWLSGTMFTDQPVVVATLGDHVLLQIAFRRGRSSAPDYFVYKPRAHLLYPIPQYGKRLVDERCRAGLLPHGGNGHHYHITGLVMRDSGEFDLFLYSSMTQTWTIKRPVLMLPKPDDIGFDFETYKVIPVGGGSMVAFVDIWNGILFCDALDGECPELHHVPLPSTGLCRESTPRVSSVVTPRDVTIVEKVSTGYDGNNSSCLCIWFVEVVCHPIFESWHAALWSTTTAAVTPCDSAKITHLSNPIMSRSSRLKFPL